jgi:HSP20 family molecular chaperone IbpA
VARRRDEDSERRTEHDDEQSPFRIPTAWPFPSPDEIERRFERLIRSRWGGTASVPAADVFVHGREVWVEVDLPGVIEQEVRARVEAGVLVIEATRRFVPPAREARPAALERPRGPIRRAVPLPTRARRARLEYRLESGVLRVRILPEEER